MISVHRFKDYISLNTEKGTVYLSVNQADSLRMVLAEFIYDVDSLDYQDSTLSKQEIK